jgi:hypothetical protein
MPKDTVRPDKPVELEARPASSVYNRSLRRSSSQSNAQISRPVSPDFGYPDESTLARSKYEADSGKRDTSFTALMEHCKIPDSGDPYPVPKLPDHYRGKR